MSSLFLYDFKFSQFQCISYLFNNSHIPRHAFGASGEVKKSTYLHYLLVRNESGS